MSSKILATAEAHRQPGGGRRARAGQRLALAAGLVLGGCLNTGVDGPGPVASQPVEGDVTDGVGDTDPDVGLTPGESSDCSSGRLARRAVWLSDIQYTNAITRLLGASALDPALVADAAVKPFSQKGVVVTTAMLRTRLDLATRAAQSLSGRFTDATGCALTDEACARQFVGDLAEQAFRRPVLETELGDLNAVFDAGRQTDVETAVQLATQAVIASPSFSYRTEFGSGAATPSGNVELTGDELASMLSFWLTDSPPDDELSAAARQGMLSEPAELERHVDRLLSSPEGQNSLTLTLMSAWGMSNVFGASKDPGLFPEYGPLLQSNMFEETRLFLNEALWGEGGSLGQVLTSRRSFVNEALADLYGVPFPGANPTEFLPVELPEGERAGLLTQASLLSARARSDNTSVVARGLFVRSALLCLPRPPPPPEDVIQQVQDLLAADLTERERADVRAMTSPCNGCHQSVDVFGLMLENYDPIGRFREELEGGVAIDASVELDAVGFPGTFNGAVDFVASAAESEQFSACVARHLAVYATGDDGLATRDCEFDEFTEMAPTQTDLRQIVTSLAGSALLRTRSGE